MLTGPGSRTAGSSLEGKSGVPPLPKKDEERKMLGTAVEIKQEKDYIRKVYVANAKSPHYNLFLLDFNWKQIHLKNQN